MSLKPIVQALGGDLYDRGLRANIPAPGHSAADRSVSLLLREGRVIVHTFGDGDWKDVLDYLRGEGLVDAHNAPLGWVDTANLSGDTVTERDVNLCGTTARRGDPLRELLNSALSSPSGRSVITDDAGKLLGTVTDHDIVEAIRRAKDSRS